MLSFERFSIKTSKGLYLLKDINFEVKEKETVCIIGKSGSGKSTILKAIMGILDKELIIEGNIYYKGIDLIKNVKKIRGKDITIVFQNPFEYIDSFYKIRHHLKALKKDIKRAADLIEKFDLPLDILEKYPFELSGGELQRVYIVLALLNDPSLILFDEPTSSLDKVSEYEVVCELIRFKKELSKSFLIVTHNKKIASMIADKIIVIEKGCVKNIINNNTQ